MRRHNPVGSTLIALLGLLLGIAQEGLAQAEAKGASSEQMEVAHPRVKGIRGRLFRENRNELESEDVIIGDRSPWNVIISSNILMIFVDIEGPPVSESSRGAVDLQVRTKSGIIYSKTLPLRKFFTHKGEVLTIPFVLYETGCVPMYVVATIRGAGGPASTIKATIPFTCGE